MPIGVNFWLYIEMENEDHYIDLDLPIKIQRFDDITTEDFERIAKMAARFSIWAVDEDIDTLTRAMQEVYLELDVRRTNVSTEFS